MGAVVNCWGGGIVESADDDPDTGPVAPDYLSRLAAPMLGLFGNDDKRPSPDDVDVLEEALRRLGEDPEFHRYHGAGHAFFDHNRPNYRVDQAVDGWNRVWDFLGRTLR